ncbi:MAG: 1-(5-phosphoribosyl)-5-[(5-phosphoribosylamino)methylideneamino]imidazole-4-carboxamide isomerase [Pseudomonadota bacterium]
MNRNTFTLYPAIDLLDGQCVRLQKGDFAQKTVYSKDPVAMAMSFKEAGAEWLHLVDLSGARKGHISQRQLIGEMAQQSGIKIQVGGGIRTLYDAREYLTQGAQRIILGSLVIKDQKSTQMILKELGPDQVVFALDGKINQQGKFLLSTHGWQEDSQVELETLINQYLPLGLKYILCTDISRDGMMVGPNIQLYQQIKKSYPDLYLMASGGISSLQDVQALQKSGIDGAIAGKAIYEGKLDLKEVFQC